MEKVLLVALGGGAMASGVGYSVGSLAGSTRSEAAADSTFTAAYVPLRDL